MHLPHCWKSHIAAQILPALLSAYTLKEVLLQTIWTQIRTPPPPPPPSPFEYIQPVA